MNLLIGADVVPVKADYDLFKIGDIETLLGKELLELWNKSDVRIFNLEVPLADTISPIEKCGPNLIAPTETINGIKKLNPTLITLSNNHILDHGTQGLQSTIDILNENKIPFVGAGMNLEEACKPYIIEKNNIKIGIYSCTEHEFTIARENKAGANPFDPLESLDHIQDLKEECDYLIVLYHGGKEHYRYPSPYLQKVCRKIVKKGCDLVICQHSHCIGAYEEYENGKIIYGQGNFIFNGYSNEYWDTSLLINLEFNSDKNVNLKYIPICKNGENSIRLATEYESNQILGDFNNRSDLIKDDFFVKAEYEKFAMKSIDNYLYNFSSFNKITRKISRITKNRLLNRKYNKRKLLAIQNFIECEAHRELIITGLDKK